MSSQERIRKYTRVWWRKPRIDADLNVMPQCESQCQEGTSTHAGSQHADAGQQGSALLPEPIDLEAFDDDVIISSPRTFAEAKINARRNHGRTVVIDVDSEGRFSHNKRKRTPANEIIINLDVYNELVGNNNSMTNNVQSMALPSPQPKELTFRCPVCMGPFVEEMSTKCGHIFCKACIHAAITAQRKCPTCRRKITMKNIIRVYLPATSCT
ncbi:RING/U-box superfamily protein [Abeliophyllum distichum]|uniref:RING/U-box superfamily protein n=1 Tax=Abeliophyllum distichum TaxID=126358 RepID=A0ABD1VTP5_9LAMI